MIEKLVTALVAGYSVLIIAIAINAVAMAVGLTTWYGFIEDPSIGVMDGLFLFLFYPIALGFGAMLGVLAGRRIWSFGRRRPSNKS